MPQSAILTPKPFFPIVMATMTTEQTISNGLWTTIALSAEYLDIFSAWNTTSYIFTVPKTSTYRFLIWSRAIVTGQSGAVDTIAGVSINGGIETHIQRSYHASPISFPSVNAIIPFLLLNQGDTIEFKSFINTGGTPTIKLQPYQTQACIEMMN